jgi:hypothetical protein
MTTALTALLRLLAPMTFIVLAVSLLAPLSGPTVSYARRIAQVGLMLHLCSCWRPCFTAILHEEVTESGSLEASKGRNVFLRCYASQALSLISSKFANI